MPREARKNHRQALGLHKIASRVTKIHIFMQTILDSIDKSQNQLDKNCIVGEIPLLNAYITKESAISTQENDDRLNIPSNKCIILQSFEIIFKKHLSKSTKLSLFS
jgi:hypothetical protein